MKTGQNVYLLLGGGVELAVLLVVNVKELSVFVMNYVCVCVCAPNNVPIILN